MESKAFWIWKSAMRKKEERERKDSVQTDVDYNLALALSRAALSDNKPSGDGRFSRIENYAKELRQEMEWVRRNWTGNDEELNSYLLGCDLVITGIENTIKTIKKGR